MDSLKENAIKNYLMQVDFKRDNWNYQIIEEEMRKFLGERPSLEPHYKKDVILNEDSGKSQEITKLEAISVVFTDLDDKIKKIKILL
jgi:predicted RNA-binding protein Jag